MSQTENPQPLEIMILSDRVPRMREILDKVRRDNYAVDHIEKNQGGITSFFIDIKPDKGFYLLGILVGNSKILVG